MSNVNFYPQTPIIKQEQPVNSHFIQKILDENVSLIHTIMEKQQQHHTQESDELLKNLHKNLIYLATIADQTTSAGNQGPNISAQTPYNYSSQGAQVVMPPQSYNTNVPMQQSPQQFLMGGGNSVNEAIEKKHMLSEEEALKEAMNKCSYNTTCNVDMDKDSPLVKDIATNATMITKMAESDKDSSSNVHSAEVPKDVNAQRSTNIAEVMPKSEENMFGQSHNESIKTDMPPPSQLPSGVHPEKNPAHFLPNQRFAYPGASPAFNQYGPHFDQGGGKFYGQSPYQQSPYNYQGMYNPYQAVPPAMSAGHYNPHMINSGAMYSQYPYYQQPGMEHLSKDSVPMSQPAHAPSNSISQQLKQPDTQTSTTHPNMSD